MSIIINKLTYMHPDKEVLFQDISFSLQKGDKISLIGNNGSGKSTLLKVLSGDLKASAGNIVYTGKIYYVPQHFGQYDDSTIIQVLNIDRKIKALRAILAGDASDDNFTILDDDWNIEERMEEALAFWGLEHLKPEQKMQELSGGEKTKVFLAGIKIYEPDIILFDEPSNHLDTGSRKKLYDFITEYNAIMLAVSHDRMLLNLFGMTYELSKKGIEVYGGNYEIYKIQKEEKINALHNQLEEKEKQLRYARKVARETAERKQRQNSRGKNKGIKEGVPRIVLNGLQSKAENSTSKLKEIHEGKMQGIKDDLSQIRQKLPDSKELKMNFKDAFLHTGKILVTAKDINFGYSQRLLWQLPLNFQIRSGDRVCISGKNGIGKTTLLKLILGKLEAIQGILTRNDFSYIYVDQEYSVIDNSITVLEQIERYNTRKLLDYELKTLLHRFLFPSDTWNKACSKLSGGEKMRLILCCLTTNNNTPDMFILDEPTNNLDIQSMEIMTSVIKDYEGSVLVISHDRYFLKEIGVDKQIKLS